MNNEQIENIIKEALGLRTLLKSGMINTVKLDNFLNRVIKLKDPAIRKRVTKERFNNQLVRMTTQTN